MKKIYIIIGLSIAALIFPIIGLPILGVICFIASCGLALYNMDYNWGWGETHNHTHHHNYYFGYETQNTQQYKPVTTAPQPPSKEYNQSTSPRKIIRWS